MNTIVNLQNSFLPPNSAAWFGFDPFGVPLHHRILNGAFFSISISLISATISVIFAILISALQIYTPQTVSNIIQKFVIGLLAFPGLLLAILFAVILPPSNTSVIIVLTFTSWAGTARVFYGIMKSNLEEEYIQASKAFGASSFWIFRTHLLRKLTPFIYLQFIFIFTGTLLAESSLSFLGIGTPLDSPSWGRLIAQGRQYLIEAPHLSIYPGITLFLTIFLLQLTGNYFQKSKFFTKIK